MVKFSIFSSSKNKDSQQHVKNLEKYREIAYRLLKSGKTENEVAAYLKSHGLSYEQIDSILNDLIKSATLSTRFSPPPPPASFPLSPPKTHQKAELQQPPQQSNQNISHQLDVQSLVNTILEKVLIEMEELVDLIIEKKYGNLKKDIKELNELKVNIENMDKKLKEFTDNLSSQINEKLENIEKTIASLDERINQLEPKINALESAFKDTVPNIIDDLRKVEEMISEKSGEEESFVLSLKKEEETKKNKKEKEEESDTSSSEFKFDDLIN